MPKNHDEKILSVNEQIAQLQNRKKGLLQQKNQEERKARTRRLIERGAILESLIENAESLTNNDIKTILENALKINVDKETAKKAENPLA